MRTPEQKAKDAERHRKRWATLDAETKRAINARNVERARQRRAKAGPSVRKSTKGTRRVDVNKHERYRFVLQLKFERAQCFDCGWLVDEWNHAAMEWDHRIPADKSFAISSAIKTRGLDYAAIRAETEKCDLVCANCHRMRTYWGRDHDHRPAPKQPDNEQMGLFDDI